MELNFAFESIIPNVWSGIKLLVLWTSQGLNLGPPDYESLKVIFNDIPLFGKCAEYQRFTKMRFSLNIRKYP